VPAALIARNPKRGFYRGCDRVGSSQQACQLNCYFNNDSPSDSILARQGAELAGDKRRVFTGLDSAAEEAEQR